MKDLLWLQNHEKQKQKVNLQPSNNLARKSTAIKIAVCSSRVFRKSCILSTSLLSLFSYCSSGISKPSLIKKGKLQITLSYWNGVWFKILQRVQKYSAAYENLRDSKIFRLHQFLVSRIIRNVTLCYLGLLLVTLGVFPPPYQELGSKYCSESKNRYPKYFSWTNFWLPPVSYMPTTGLPWCVSFPLLVTPGTGGMIRNVNLFCLPLIGLVCFPPPTGQPWCWKQPSKLQDFSNIKETKE